MRSKKQQFFTFDAALARRSGRDSRFLCIVEVEFNQGLQTQCVGPDFGRRVNEAGVRNQKPPRKLATPFDCFSRQNWRSIDRRPQRQLLHQIALIFEELLVAFSDLFGFKIDLGEPGIERRVELLGLM